MIPNNLQVIEHENKSTVIEVIKANGGGVAGGGGVVFSPPTLLKIIKSY